MASELSRFPNVRWHDLRHACATWLLEAGLDHFAVSVLGDGDGGALVMSRYGHPSKAAALDRLLGTFDADTRRSLGRSASLIPVRRSGGGSPST